jgi:hypothetical protein
VTEAVPVFSGGLLGLVMGYFSPSVRLPAVALFSILLGICASAVTGELSISWTYVLIDIPLVALSATVCLVAARSFVLRRGRPRSRSGAYG